MNHLFNFIVFSLLLINLIGIGVGATRLTQLPYGLAKSFGVTLGCLVFFCVEHFIGFGHLTWLLPISTAGAGWVIWKDRARWREFRGGELAFLFGFVYTLSWRYSFPNIDASSEKLADLNYVASYLQGTRLPVPDLWLSPYLLTQYYSFQHYAAALMGRILQLGPGASYNVAYCVVVGLVMTAAQAFVRSFTANRFFQVLILTALLMGGTGACFFTPILVKSETLWSSMRFVGSTIAEDDAALTPAGIWLREFEYGKGQINDKRRETILELPMESFPYVVQLGDYHPPLGGYVLLATALAAFGVLLRRPQHKWAIAALLGTVPLCIAVNTWCFPLQGLLVLLLVGFVWRYRGQPDLRSAVASIFITLVLLYPYLTYFLGHNVGSAMSVKLVQAGQHTPALAYLMQFWPVLVLVGLACSGAKPRNYLWFAGMVAGFLLLTEVIYFHDIYSGRFERFNTTLKWWPWVAFLALLLLAPLNLSDEQRRSRGVRIGTVLLLLSTLFYLNILGKKWLEQSKTALGKLDGDAWLWLPGSDPAQPQNLNITHSVVNYLLAHPGGVVLECPIEDRQAFVETGAIPLMAGHPTVFGWSSHEQLWRGYQKDIEVRRNRTVEFFKGTLANPLDFLESMQVRYILWPIGDPVDPALFEKISAQIGTRYLFLRFDEGDPKHGIWVHR